MSENPQKVAIYPGSFNPLHIGHLDVVAQALKIFDKVILLHAINPDKIKIFPNIQKWEMEEIIEHQLVSYLGKNRLKIEYDETSGLLYKYCEEHNIHHIVRGIRGTTDLEFELNMRFWNMHLARSLAGGYLNTVLLATEKPGVSSSSIRNLAGILNEDEFVTAVMDKVNLDPNNSIEREFLGKLWRAYK